LHLLEFELPRAHAFMERWSMNPCLPPGMKEAQKKRLELDGLSLSDLEAMSPIVARYQLIMTPTRVKKSFWKNPKADCASPCGGAGKSPWKYLRGLEFAVRLTNLDRKANSLESALDLEISAFIVWKERENATTPMYSSQQPHCCRFAEFPTGEWNLAQVNRMLQCQEDSALIDQFTHHLKMMGEFLKMAKRDCDRLLKLVHDGKSCRYYPRCHPNIVLDPHYPFYLQIEQTGRDKPDFESVAQHKGECKYCVLDRRCVQVEEDMKMLFTYLKQWRRRLEVTTGLPQGTRAQYYEKMMRPPRRPTTVSLDVLLGETSFPTEEEEPLSDSESEGQPPGTSFRGEEEEEEEHPSDSESEGQHPGSPETEQPLSSSESEGVPFGLPRKLGLQLLDWQSLAGPAENSQAAPFFEPFASSSSESEM